MDVDDFIDRWADHHRHLSPAELYREQDRIIAVIERLHAQVTKPFTMIHVLERELEALEILIDTRHDTLKISS